MTPLLQSYLRDVGPYCAVLALFNGVITYRANPRGSVNRFFASFCGLVAFWQLVVAAARVTHHYPFWSAVAAPFGPVMILAIFCLHDAAIHPTSSIRLRLRRNLFALLAALVLLLHDFLDHRSYGLPGFYPYSFRVVCYGVLLWAFVEAHRQRRSSARRVNTYDLYLFNGTAIYLLLLFAIFMLLGTPSRSRIMSGVTVFFLVTSGALILSERVLDTRGTARTVALHAVTFLAHGALLFLLLVGYNIAGGDLHALPLWGIALVATVINYPIFLVTRAAIQRGFGALRRKAAQMARERALNAAARGETAQAIVAETVAICRFYLGDVEVSLRICEETFQGDAELTAGCRELATYAVRGWLTPERALSQHRGKELERILAAFQAEQLGAIVTHESQGVTGLLCVGERSRGTKPITREEIGFLREILAIAITGLQRVRALEQVFRARGLVIVGRMAATYNHEARNRLEAITSLLEALDERPHEPLPTDFVHAVRVQATDLALSHALALEMTRLRPDRLRIQPLDLRQQLEMVAGVYGQLARRERIAFRLESDGPPILAAADAPMLRQVILNLIRNGVQAAKSIGVDPIITMETRAGAEGVCIDVVDNGPGVAAEIHDHLFAPWVTSKHDGTGLGLSFCIEAMRFMQGGIGYMTSRGQPHARFRLTLPAAPGTPSADLPVAKATAPVPS